jgi:hypothetical protein
MPLCLVFYLVDMTMTSHSIVLHGVRGSLFIIRTGRERRGAVQSKPPPPQKKRHGKERAEQFLLLKGGNNVNKGKDNSDI